MRRQEQNLLGCRETHGTRVLTVTSSIRGGLRRPTSRFFRQVRLPRNAFSPSSLGTSRSWLCPHPPRSQAGTTRHLKPLHLLPPPPAVASLCLFPLYLQCGPFDKAQLKPHFFFFCLSFKIPVSLIGFLEGKK